MRSIQLTNVADWHASKASDYYLKGDMGAYAHHIAIHDRLIMLSGLSINRFAV